MRLSRPHLSLTESAKILKRFTLLTIVALLQLSLIPPSNIIPKASAQTAPDLSPCNITLANDWLKNANNLTAQTGSLVFGQVAHDYGSSTPLTAGKYYVIINQNTDYSFSTFDNTGLWDYGARGTNPTALYLVDDQTGTLTRQPNEQAATVKFTCVSVANVPGVTGNFSSTFPANPGATQPGATFSAPPPPPAPTVQYLADTCPHIDFGYGDLPKLIKDQLPDYKNGTDGLLVYKGEYLYSQQDKNGNYPNHGNFFAVLVDIGGQFNMNLVTGFPDITASSGQIYTAGLNWTPKENYPDWPGTDDQRMFLQPFETVSNERATSLFNAPDGGALGCVGASMGLNYGASWTYAPLVTGLPYAATPPALDMNDPNNVKCPAFPLPDITCWTRKIFVPSTNSMTSFTTSLSDWFKTKFGFLAYAVSIIGDILGLFLHPDPANCTVNGCYKNFGAMFGHPFIVDFASVAKTMPSVWIFATMFVRGAIIIGFMFMSRNKIQSIMRK
jgi:hypothetical protein